MALEALMGTCCMQTCAVCSVRDRNGSRYLFYKCFCPPDKLSYLSVKAQKWPRVRAGTGKAVVVLGGTVASL